MLRRSIAVLAIAAALVVCAGTPSVADTFLLDRFKDYLESLRVQSGIPGLGAAIVGPTDILWEREFGQQDVERSVATRVDTPFHADGLTEIVTAALALSCVEQGHLSLDDRIGDFNPRDSDADSTIRQVLTHTSGAPDNLVYAHRPDRLEPLDEAIRSCNDRSFRETTADLLERFAMVDSVPGPDVIRPNVPAGGFPTETQVARYTRVMGRLAVPYTVDGKGRPTPSQYPATRLTPSSGLIGSVRDFAQFDLALKNGLLVSTETLAEAWQAPIARGGQRLPHGIGWFVHTYNGETIVWQFGMGENASSSMIVTAPSRGLTLILLANSTGLVKPFPLAAGDLSVSPFARLFLELFIR